MVDGIGVRFRAVVLLSKHMSTVQVVGVVHVYLNRKLPFIELPLEPLLLPLRKLPLAPLPLRGLMKSGLTRWRTTVLI